jgi:fructokinase
MEGPVPFQVLAVGEILWDLLPAGRQLGGAPANFIQHARALGADAGLVSRVGDDELGREAVARLCARGVDTDLIQVDPLAPTGTVGVEIGADHQPQFTIHENVAWDRIAVEDAALAAVRDADAVCYGSLAQRTAEGAAAVRRLVRASNPDALRIFDINLRPPFVQPEVIRESLELATVLKLNNHELPVLAAMLGMGGTEERQLDELVRRYSLRLIALTRGGQGSLLVGAKGRSEQPAVAVDVVDTVGAGDAFTAALVVGLLHAWPLQETNRLAADVAAFVCTRPGGAPELPPDLCRRTSGSR